MWHELQRQRNFLAALLVVALLGIAVPAGASSGAGGAGGSGGGGGGGEDIGVAQEADSLCCCAIPVVDGSPMSCQLVASSAGCPPYTTDFPRACSSGPPPPVCSLADAPGVPSTAGVMGLVLLATAAATALRRRFARRPLVPLGARDETPEKKSEI
jgi:hypothetical protein